MSSPPARADPGRLAQLVDYVGVDYAAAVADGEIVNAFEYREMQEFAGLIGEQVRALASEDARRPLLPLPAELQAAVQAKAAPAEVAGIAGRMTEILLASGTLASAPDADPEIAAQVYLWQCAGCHGANGRGDGPAARAGMEPTPADFTDRERARARSLYGLFNTITLSVEGTAMP